MRGTLRLFGYLSITIAAGCLMLWLTNMGRIDLVAAGIGFLLNGVVLLSLEEILGRLNDLQFFIEASNITGIRRLNTKQGDFARLGNVEGEAMCLGCRKIAPKADMYYSQSLDVYYHPQCLARDCRGGK